MASVRYTIRYRSGTQMGGAVIVEDGRGDLYACTDAGPFCRFTGERLLASLLKRGWVAVEGDGPQPLATILRTLAPTP